jgi:hypothetical protein
MFQLNGRGYVPCDMQKSGATTLDDEWRAVAAAWALQTPTPIDAHPNCHRVCCKHRRWLGLGFKRNKGVLSRLPDSEILVLMCVACRTVQKKLSFATEEMQRAINKDHGVATGLAT